MVNPALPICDSTLRYTILYSKLCPTIFNTSKSKLMHVMNHTVRAIATSCCINQCILLYKKMVISNSQERKRFLSRGNGDICCRAVSVCPSATFVGLYCVKTKKKHILKLFSPSAKCPHHHSFSMPKLWQSSNGGGVSKNCDFRLISRFISEILRYRVIGLVNMEYEIFSDSFLFACVDYYCSTAYKITRISVQSANDGFAVFPRAL